MDTTLQGYMLSRLDRLEELQRQQIQLLERILETLQARTPTKRSATSTKSGFLQKLKLPPLSQIVIGGACSWGISSAISTYLSHGGDPLKVLEVLLKLFG